MVRATRTSRPKYGAGYASDIKRNIENDPAVSGTLEVTDISWLRVARITAARHRVAHEPSALFRPAVAVFLQISGESVIEQSGRTARLAPGHWNVCDSAQSYILTSPQASQRLLLLIPHERVNDDIDIQGITVPSFPGTVGVGRLVFGIAGWLAEEATSIGSARADVFASTVTQFINLAIQEHSKERPKDHYPAEALAKRIRAYIASHLRDPDLSLDSIASHLNYSKRSLHRAIDTSIHNLIWHQRLDHCRRELCDPSRSHVTIAVIARSWGFKNAAHFSEAFKERFGIAPRDLRRSDPVAGDPPHTANAKDARRRAQRRTST